MHATYIQYDFQVNPLQPATEILIAQLGEAGFESFVENELGVTAYIQQKDWHESILEEVWILTSKEFKISYQQKKIPQTNWNETWEKNFNPIQVDDKVSVRAPFHQNPNLEFDIVIEPKMSFGTGHHETTHMMVQQILSLDVQGKSVLDMGSGTGILAIFSEMKGATSIDAIDIDAWCYENSLENIKRNQCKNIRVFKGDASLLQGKTYDIILANINRNVLVQDMETYHLSLLKNGQLVLSGFYEEDIPVIDKKATTLGLQNIHTLKRNKWVSLRYQK